MAHYCEGRTFSTLHFNSAFNCWITNRRINLMMSSKIGKFSIQNFQIFIFQNSCFVHPPSPRQVMPRTNTNQNATWIKHNWYISEELEIVVVGGRTNSRTVETVGVVSDIFTFSKTYEIRDNNSKKKFQVLLFPIILEKDKKIATVVLQRFKAFSGQLSSGVPVPLGWFMTLVLDKNGTMQKLKSKFQNFHKNISTRKQTRASSEVPNWFSKHQMCDSRNIKSGLLHQLLFRRRIHEVHPTIQRTIARELPNA